MSYNKILRRLIRLLGLGPVFLESYELPTMCVRVSPRDVVGELLSPITVTDEDFDFLEFPQKQKESAVKESKLREQIFLCLGILFFRELKVELTAPCLNLAGKRLPYWSYHTQLGAAIELEGVGLRRDPDNIGDLED